MNLVSSFQEASSGREGAVAFRMENAPAITYGQLWDRVAALTAALAAAGAEADRAVVVQVDKSIDAFALYLATVALGAIYVPLNIAYTEAELLYFLDDADPSLVVARPGQDPVGATRPWMTLGADGTGTLLDLIDGTRVAPVERAERDIAAMLYTSGTTGRSKGARLTHEGLRTNAEALRTIWGWRTDDVLLHFLPIFHVHGLFVAMHCALLGASETLWLDRFDPERVLELLPDATVMMGVPTHYRRLLDTGKLDPEALGGMRLFTSGSAPMTALLHDEFTAASGHRIVERYGMTECGIITSNPLDGERVAGTVGFALPGVELRIVNDEGVVIGRGETGVVETRSRYMFAQYHGRPDATAEAMRDDDFFVTGDVGHLDEDGRLTLEGREGDMIISGGLNVYPKEIEMVLDELAGIAETAVVGLPHPDFGEAVTVFVAPDPTMAPRETAELQATVDQGGLVLASFKRPKRMIVVDELPRNTMGKVQKAMLRRDYAELYRGAGEQHLRATNSNDA